MPRHGVALLAVLILGLVGCGGDGPTAPAGTPIQELFDAGRCPVEVTGIARTIAPAPTFRATLRNLSDAPVSAVTWTAVFRDAEGAPIGDPTEGGYADILAPIPAGGSIEGMFIAPDPSAASARVVVKSLVYTKPNPINPSLSGIRATWVNPRHARDLAGKGP